MNGLNHLDFHSDNYRVLVTNVKNAVRVFDLLFATGLFNVITLKCRRFGDTENFPTTFAISCFAIRVSTKQW
jgi:hypothetical protein